MAKRDGTAALSAKEYLPLTGTCMLFLLRCNRLRSSFSVTWRPRTILLFSPLLLSVIFALWVRNQNSFDASSLSVSLLSPSLPSVPQPLFASLSGRVSYCHCHAPRAASKRNLKISVLNGNSELSFKACCRVILWKPFHFEVRQNNNVQEYSATTKQQLKWP